MKINMTRNITITSILTLLFLFLFTGCNRVDLVADGDSTTLNTYIYQPEQISLLDFSYPVQGITTHREQIYYWYVDSTSNLVLVRTATNGSEKSETRIPVHGERVSIIGLSFIDDDKIRFIKSSNYDGDTHVSSNIYSFNSAEISSLELGGFDGTENIAFRVEQAVYTGNDHIALVIGGAGHAKELHIFDNEGISLGKFALDYYQNIVSLKDGRLAALFRVGENMELRILGFSPVEWGDRIPLNIQNAQRLFPTESNQNFDLLVDDGNFLYGYSIDTSIRTPLINWMETGLVLTHNYNIAALWNENFIVQYAELSVIGNSIEWLNDLFVLTPTLRKDMPEQQTVITLGGTWFPDDIRREVTAFNRENNGIQIELRDYREGTPNTHEGWVAAQTRFRIEMVTGRGPDMVVNDIGFKESGLLADLYPFIDSDSEINRTDFFPNVLSLMEAVDNSLPIISNRFSVETMITLRETAEKLKPFTFDTILRRLNEPDQPLLFAEYVNRDRFLGLVTHFSGNRYIDWINNKANLDTDDFISLLEIAERLSVPQDNIEVDHSIEWERLQRGEQLLYILYFSDVNIFRDYQARFGDIVAVGMPGTNVGQHAIQQFFGGIGINAGSKHQDEAWSFIRRLLLAETHIDHSFPLRIDKFDELITEEMTPNIVDGKEVPLERWFSGEQYYLYAMTDIEAATIREIIETASLSANYDETIWMIINEDTQPFFAGARTAADTARIIQNRVQTYLDERD